MAKKKAIINWRAYVALAVLMIGLITALLLFIRPSFSITGAWNCDAYNASVSRTGVVSVVNGSLNAEAATGLEVYINGSLVTTLSVPALAAGQQWTSSTPVQVPSTGSFTWMTVVTADRNCTDTGSYQALGCVPVNFSKLPDGSTPSDNLVINDQYLQSSGMSFSIEPSRFSPSGACTSGPKIALTGKPVTAFVGVNSAADTVYANSTSQSPYLTDDGVNQMLWACTLVVNFAPGSRGKTVAFDIVDIDGNEQYKVDAYDQSGTLVKSLTYPTTGVNGHARGRKVTVQADVEIAKVKVMPTRLRSQNQWGLAYDNFQCAN